MSEAAGGRELDLEDLADGSMPGLNSEVGRYLAQAGGVCLDSQRHVPGVVLSVTGITRDNYSLTWAPIDDQARRSWNDDQEATEHGAYGIAVILVHAQLGYAVTSRSRKGTGFDYWLGRHSFTVPFEDEARLEVSGIRSGTSTDITKRVRAKQKQVAQRPSPLPGFVVVVEFSCPQAVLARA